MGSAQIINLDRETSPGDFRNAMRHLVGAVSIITVGHGDDVSGMTVTSLSSLSVEPPSLIVSVNRAASSWPLLQRYGSFGVNILSSGQRDIAERFSGKNGLKGAARFAGSSQWVARAGGAPQMYDALTRWWAPLLLAWTSVSALGSLFGLATRRYRFARAAAIAQVALILTGWSLAQFPHLIVPYLDIAATAAPEITLRLLAIALGLGALVLLPSLYYLFRVFKRAD